MGWQERDYSDEPFSDTMSTAWHMRRPPAAALTLAILHGVAFFVMLALASAKPAAPVPFALSGAQADPLAIVLHPISTKSVLSAVFVVFAMWSLAGRLEGRLGARRLVLLYLLGNTVAGAAYFGVSRAVPGWAVAPLDYPVGALAAFGVAAWRHLRSEAVAVFGRIANLAKVYLLCAALTIGVSCLAGGRGAVAWLIAVVAGAVSACIVVYWSATPQIQSVRRRTKPATVFPISKPAPLEPNIDDILSKISREGMQSLTAGDRQRLEAARQAKLRAPR